MSVIFRKNNPKRPVDWRWQLAGELLARQSRIRRSAADPMLQKAISFRRQLERCETDDDYLHLLTVEPHAYEAWALFDDNQDCGTKWELEARLLTQQTYAEIADTLALDTEAVRCYEGMFFNVSDRLRNPSYITQVVLSKSIHAGLTERAYDTLWKMYGYWAGHHVLNAIIYKFNAPAVPTSADGVRAFLDDDAKDSLRLKTILAARTLPVNWETQLEILNIYLRMTEIEKNAGDSRIKSEAMLTNINTLFTQIPWTKPRPGIDEVDQGDPVAVIDMSGNTLKASELAIISANKAVPPALLQLLGTIKFPEVAHAKDGEKAK